MTTLSTAAVDVIDPVGRRNPTDFLNIKAQKDGFNP
jgi:hypothetical protein